MQNKELLNILWYFVPTPKLDISRMAESLKIYRMVEEYANKPPHAQVRYTTKEPFSGHTPESME